MALTAQFGTPVVDEYDIRIQITLSESADELYKTSIAFEHIDGDGLDGIEWSISKVAADAFMCAISFSGEKQTKFKVSVDGYAIGASSSQPQIVSSPTPITLDVDTRQPILVYPQSGSITRVTDDGDLDAFIILNRKCKFDDPMVAGDYKIYFYSRITIPANTKLYTNPKITVYPSNIPEELPSGDWIEVTADADHSLAYVLRMPGLGSNIPTEIVLRSKSLLMSSLVA